MDGLTISQLATQGGVNLQTVRYYERRGLLTASARTEAGYRIFQPEAVHRIHFIKRAQDLGFSLRDIKELLSLRADAHCTRADVRKRVQAKLADVELKIRQLEVIHASLSQLSKSCRGYGSTNDCPILENLDVEGFYDKP